MIVMNLNIVRENISCGMMGNIAVVTGDGTDIDFLDTTVNSNQWKIGTYIYSTMQHFLSDRIIPEFLTTYTGAVLV